MQYSSHTKVYLTNFQVGLNVLHLPSHALFTRQATNRAALLDVTECDVWMASSWTRLTNNDMCTMFTSCLRGLNNASSNTTWKKIAGMKTVDCYTLWQWHCWQQAIVWIWDTLGIQSPWLLDSWWKHCDPSKCHKPSPSDTVSQPQRSEPSATPLSETQIN